MSDPSKLDLGDWLAAIITGSLAGLASAAAWFRGSKERIYVRINEQESRMDAHEKTTNAHSTELAVIHTNQDHMSHRLDEIRRCGERTNQKLDAVLEAMTGWRGKHET
jgi:hypothetical protein